MNQVDLPLQGGFKTVLHFAQAVGMTRNSVKVASYQGDIPPLPKPLMKAGGMYVYSEDDFQQWLSLVPAWREGLPARRAAERAENAARYQRMLEEQRKKALAPYAKAEAAQ